MSGEPRPADSSADAELRVVVALERPDPAAVDARDLNPLTGAGAPAAFGSVDRDGRVVAIEGDGLKLLGLRPAQLLGRSIFALGPQWDQLRSMHREVMQGRTLLTGLSLGDQQWACAAWPARSSAGDVLAMDCLVVDQTGVHDGEPAQPVRADDRPGLGPVVHREPVSTLARRDLRGPMAGITGYCELLTEHWDELDDEIRRECVQRLGRQAEALKLVTARLLAASSTDDVLIRLTEDNPT